VFDPRASSASDAFALDTCREYAQLSASLPYIRDGNDFSMKFYSLARDRKSDVSSRGASRASLDALDSSIRRQIYYSRARDTSTMGEINGGINGGISESISALASSAPQSGRIARDERSKFLDRKSLPIIARPSVKHEFPSRINGPAVAYLRSCCTSGPSLGGEAARDDPGSRGNATMPCLYK